MSFEANAYIRTAPIADSATREAVADLLDQWNDYGEPTPDLFRGPAEVHNYGAASISYSSWSPLPALKELGVAFYAEQEPGESDEGPSCGEWVVFVPGVGEDSGDDIGPDGRVVRVAEVMARLDEILSGGLMAVVGEVKAYRAELAKAGAEELRAAFEALCATEVAAS